MYTWTEYTEPDWAAIVHAVRTGNKPEKGQVWYSGNTRIEVREVDPDGDWAWIDCEAPMTSYGLPDETAAWDKKQPLVDRRFPNDWKQA